MQVMARDVNLGMAEVGASYGASDVVTFRELSTSRSAKQG